MGIKNDNFKRITDGRVNKIVTLISSLSNLSNSSFYEYTDIEINQLFQTIEQEIIKTKQQLIKSNEKRKRHKKVEL